MTSVGGLNKLSFYPDRPHTVFEATQENLLKNVEGLDNISKTKVYYLMQQ